jgi:hypothetical protein
MHENREISCTSWTKDQDRSAKALTNEKEKVAVSAFQTMPSTELTRSMNRRCAATLLCPHSDTDAIEHVPGLARGGRDLKTSRAFAKQQYSATLGCRVTREETVVPLIHPNWRVFSYLNAVGYHRNSGCSPRRVADGVPMQNTRKSSLWLVAGPCSSLCARRGLSPRLLCGASLPPD